jgi:hypothetical protein
MSNTKTADRGHNFTAKGTLAPDALKRHKLNKDAIPVDEGVEFKILNGHHYRVKLKNLIESMSLYRLTSHKVLEKKLAKPLVYSAGYWLNSMKPEFKNRDRAPVAPAEADVVATS